MPSTSEPSTGSPIGRVPYDILREIFIHCLPPPGYHPHGQVQPDPRIPPILLCHICSSWRTIALTAATLWTHFVYSFHIIKGDDYDVCAASRKFKFFAREIEFVRWWRTNQGRIAPSINFLYIYPQDASAIKRRGPEDATPDTMDFLLECITSAQFLHIHEFFWHQIAKRIAAGHRVVFPNLHTLLVKYRWIANDPFYTALALLPKHAFPALRRLSICSRCSDAPLENVNIPNQWSMHTLTHVFLDASISLEFWFSCIHSAPNLRWGYFSIDCVSNSISHAVSGEYTLPHLTTLHVDVTNNLPDDFESPLLSLLFTNLHMPALRTLSLAADGMKAHWTDHHAITELYSVLKSTPAITTLNLEGGFLSLCTHSTPELLSALEDVKPVWHHAPQLVTLQIRLGIGRYLVGSVFEGIDATMEEAVELFVCNLFIDDGGWLDLRNPACPIQKLMVNTAQIRDFVIASIRENVDDAPKVVVESFEQRWAKDVACAVRDRWGARI